MQNTSVQAQPPKLQNQVVAKMRVRHYSLRTEKTYIDWIKRYIWHFDKRQINGVSNCLEINSF